jgi:HAMP domain-containing protein
MRNVLHRRFAQLSLAGRLVALNVAVSAVVLTAGSVALYSYDMSSARQRLVGQMQELARVVGANSTGALAFNDDSAAGETLRGAAFDPDVRALAILQPDGTVFARYDRDGAVSDPYLALASAATSGPWHEFDDRGFRALEPITLDFERVGWVYVASDLVSLRARERRAALVSGFVLVGGIGLAFVLTLRLQRVISGPVLRLTGVARAVQAGRYDVRAAGQGGDEVAELVGAFNDMLAEIQERDRRLHGHQ